VTLPGPRVAVGAVVVEDGRALLIRRGKAPLRGRWSIPGGAVEHGERLEEALVREMREETGLEVKPLELLTVFDRIDRDGDTVTFHYVILDYRCRRVSGEARAGSDALEVIWAGTEELEALDLTATAREVVGEAIRRFRGDALAIEAGQE